VLQAVGLSGRIFGVRRPDCSVLENASCSYACVILFFDGLSEFASESVVMSSHWVASCLLVFMFTTVGGDCDQCSCFDVSQLDSRLFDMDSRLVLTRAFLVMQVMSCVISNTEFGQTSL